MSEPHFSQSAAQAAFLDAVARSFNDPNSSPSPDLMVRWDGEDFLCHQQVLCRQSEWFRKACHGSFREAKSHIIELHDDDKVAVYAMLKYCYAFTYDDNPLATAHVQVFALAEKYFVQGLAELAIDRFNLAAADEQTSIEDITNAIAEAHATVYDQGNMMRLAITNAVMLKADIFLHGTNAAFDALMDEHPSLAADVARALMKGSHETPPEYPIWKQYRCPDACGATFEARVDLYECHAYVCTKNAREAMAGDQGIVAGWKHAKQYALLGLEWKEFELSSSHPSSNDSKMQ